MTDLALRVGFAKLAVSALLAGVAWTATRRFACPTVSHTLWLLVLVSLLVPSLIAAPLPWPGAVGGGAGPVAAAGSPGAAPVEGLGVGATLVLVWGLGAVSIFAWTLFRAFRFRRRLEAASRPASDAVQRIATSLAHDLGLGSVPPTHTTDARISPMVWWAGRTVRILIPAGLAAECEPAELRCVLAHELAHVKRRDHVVRWLEWLACAVFWWNPLAWWARRRLRAEEELCCDALVLSVVDSGSRHYAKSLLRVIEFLSTPTLRAPAFASQAGSSGRIHLIERRLEMIVSNTLTAPTPSWVRTIARTFVVAGLALGLVHCGPDRAVDPVELEPEASEVAAVDARLRAGVANGSISTAAAEEASRHWAVLDAEARAAVASGNATPEQIERRLEAAAAEVLARAASGPWSVAAESQRRVPSPIGGDVTPEALAEARARLDQLRGRVASGELTGAEGRRQLEVAAASVEATAAHLRASEQAGARR